eukprot:CAMPEP_0114252304 /NCGR_PEP_ID=MMETSP0058-20121206/15762_1 /TAXON_ID=36894 /ORGANISM="Pyramimonas parkeae, CCMP726" /LENGTH=125 /DNA_ID=CAMNT_0001366223 /DNA_START=628 /DNA_END=1001 /DNA_ORIENTATION=-
MLRQCEHHSAYTFTKYAPRSSSESKLSSVSSITFELLDPKIKREFKLKITSMMTEHSCRLIGLHTKMSAVEFPRAINPTLLAPDLYHTNLEASGRRDPKRAKLGTLLFEESQLPGQCNVHKIWVL